MPYTDEDKRNVALDAFSYAEHLPYTAKQISNMVDALRAGGAIEASASYAGISHQGLWQRLSRGAREENACSAEGLLHRDVRRALAEAESRNVSVIALAAQRNWQAAAWWLERRYPERWGRKDRIVAEVSHINMEPELHPQRVSDLQLEKLSDAELDNLRVILRKSSEDDGVIEGVVHERRALPVNSPTEPE